MGQAENHKYACRIQKVERERVQAQDKLEAALKKIKVLESRIYRLKEQTTKLQKDNNALFHKARKMREHIEQHQDMDSRHARVNIEAHKAKGDFLCQKW